MKIKHNILWLRWGGIPPWSSPSDVFPVRESKIETEPPSEQLILSALDSAPKSTLALREKTGLSDTCLRSALRRLRERGAVRISGTTPGRTPTARPINIYARVT